MKQLLYIASMLACIHASAQPSGTEEKLVAQKENIIKEGTIVKMENVGWHVNSELPA